MDRRLTITAIALWLAIPALAAATPSPLAVRVFEAEQVAVGLSSVYDATMTTVGLHDSADVEGGEARWFVNRRSAAAVVAFNAAEDGAFFLAAHELWRRNETWCRVAAAALLGFRIFQHVSGGASWRAPIREAAHAG